MEVNKSGNRPMYEILVDRINFGTGSQWVEPDHESFREMEDTYIGITYSAIMNVRQIEGLLYQHINKTGAFEATKEERDSLINERAEILRKFPINDNRQSLWDYFEPSPGLGGP